MHIDNFSWINLGIYMKSKFIFINKFLQLVQNDLFYHNMDVFLRSFKK